jgi:hypothetical protein
LPPFISVCIRLFKAHRQESSEDFTVRLLTSLTCLTATFCVVRWVTCCIVSTDYGTKCPCNHQWGNT